METNEVTKVEMERWFITKKSDLPFSLENMDHLEAMLHIEQYYISTKPIVRIRSSRNVFKNTNEFILCLKSKIADQEKGLIETEIEITENNFLEIAKHAPGNVIKKNRFIHMMHDETIHQYLNVEIDDFISHHPHIGKDEVKIEVEFDYLEDYNDFIPPVWFGKEVTNQREYSNSYLSTL